MVAQAHSFNWQFLDPARLMGPILDKELRVSSRRRMGYLIRSTYCLCLGLYVVFTWAFAVRAGTPSLSVAVSRLSEVGRRTSTAIITFQFIATQLIAVLLLSTSVADEIRKGTLSVLMTTPIGRFQIIVGKLLSGLFQLVLLLGISLPLLAIIRVFGGVPWGRIMAGLCITLTAAVLAGSLTLLLSVLCRHAYTVVLTVVVVYLLAFAALPAVLTMLAGWRLLAGAPVKSFTLLTNPFVALYTTLQQTPGSSVGLPAWPFHCLAMLGLAWLLVLLSVLLVRRATLDQAFKRVRKSGRPSSTANKPLTGSPIIWREMRRGMLGSSRSERALFFVLIGAALLIGVTIVFGGRSITMAISLILMALYLATMLRVAVLAAGAVANEKEAKTLPILLTTPLDDKSIVRDKAVAVLFRNAPLLVLYLLLYIGFLVRVQAGIMPVALLILPIMGLSTLAAVLFIIGSGVYFGSRLKTTTAALAATVGLFLVVYLVLGFGQRLLWITLYTILGVRSPGIVIQLLSMSTTILSLVFHAVAGILLSRRAAGRLRQNLF